MPENSNVSTTGVRCETCTYGKFDELWGEWKCLKVSQRVHDDRKTCENYEEKK